MKSVELAVSQKNTTDIFSLDPYYVCRIARGTGQIVNGDKGVVYTHKDLTQKA